MDNHAENRSTEIHKKSKISKRNWWPRKTNENGSIDPKTGKQK